MTQNETEVVKTMAELRSDWVAALRSGEYQQIQGKLCGENGFCCLGVAGKLIGLSIAELSNTVIDETGNSIANHSYAKIKKAYGLTTELGNFQSDTPDRNALYRLNDTANYNFNQIADVIESNPPGLFID